MATQSDLQAQEANCHDAASYAALALQAVQEPADSDYAKALLAKGEMSCSFPADYLRLAEAWVAVGDTEKAQTLYEEAENTCFDATEKAEVGYSIAKHLGDKTKGRELLEAAIAETKDTAQLLAFANYVQQGLQDNTLANQLFNKVTANCKTLADYQKLASEINAKGNVDAARLVFNKAAPSSNDTADVVAYAQGLKQLFNDDSAAKNALAEAESNCMFPAQFVALAQGFVTVANDKEKAEDLLEQGKNFAMSGEENLDLAKGYAAILNDQTTAIELFTNALREFSTKDDLLKLASAAAGALEDKSLAGQTYDKLASKLNTPADFMQVAQAVNQHLGDKDRVAALLNTAETKADTAAGLMSLASEVKKVLGDTDKVNALYAKALNKAKNYTDSSTILDALGKEAVDPTLATQVLHKALTLTEQNAQVLDVAQRAQKLLPNDNSVLLQALDKAEANVSSLDEMRKLATAVKQLAATDQERTSRIEEKLKKREASQARYVELQNQEKTFTRPAQYIQLAQTVMAELEDSSYATQLLATAEEKLQAEAYSLTRYQPLILAVGNLVGDKAWLERLLTNAAAQTTNFAQVHTLGETVSQQLQDKEFGQNWTKQFYTQQLSKLANENNPFAYGKLAKAIKEHTQDTAWAGEVLQQAEKQANTHFHYAYLADLAQAWSQPEQATQLYAKAANGCTQPQQYAELITLMRQAGVSEDKQREVYAKGEQLTEPKAKLLWIEGIVKLFNDTTWAGKIYDTLASSLTGSTAALVANSRKRNLNESSYW